MKLIDANALKQFILDNGFVYANTLDTFPTIEAAPVVHGKWLINSDGYYPYCSVCNEEPKSGYMTPYCPNCGAKMDKE